MLWKISLLSFFAIFLLIFIPKTVSAHSLGQPPYLKIDGKFVNLYAVPLSSLPIAKFNLPQDSISDNYLVNQQIEFELDKNFLPLNQDDTRSANFDWDFGDGQKAEGFKNIHSYPKIGSYILTIEIKDAKNYIPPDPSRPFESVILNILPEQSYQLPQSIIKAAEQTAKDPLLDEIKIDFSKTVQFDGSYSKNGSSKIASYFWDFGDNTSGKGAKVSHTFDKTSGQVFPVLRVTDENGFVSDSFIELTNVVLAIPQKHTNQNPVLALSTKLNDLLKRLSSEIYKQGAVNYKLLGLVLIFAFFSGALHALTPGHGKSLMAAFLIGRGSNKIVDVLVIALSLTFAHTIIIYILGILLLFITSSLPINNIIPYFDKISALIVIYLALSLIYKGYKNFKHKWDHDHQHEHFHQHDNYLKMHKKGHYVELFLAGASGGLAPCIDALALLILAASINQILFGLFLIFIFSLGLSSCIILLGLLLVLGKNKLNFTSKLGNIAEIYSPLIAGFFILFVAINLFFNS